MFEVLYALALAASVGAIGTVVAILTISIVAYYHLDSLDARDVDHE